MDELNVSVQSTIENLEGAYRSFTGHEATKTNGSHVRIPPEKDAVEYIEQTVARLEDSLQAAALAGPTWMPALDFLESAAEYIVVADLPGVDRDAMEVTCDGTLLTMSGHRVRGGAADPAVRMCRSERPTGRFQRCIALGADASGAEASARWTTDSTLEIRVPRRIRAAATTVRVDIK